MKSATAAAIVRRVTVLPLILAALALQSVATRPAAGRSDQLRPPPEQTDAGVSAGGGNALPASRPVEQAGVRTPAVSGIDDRLIGDPFGARTRLLDAGLSIRPTLIVEQSKVLGGGGDVNGEPVRHLFDLSIALDTGPALGLTGGELFADFYTVGGQSLADLTGDAQDASNIDSPPRTQLGGIWFSQTLGDLDGDVPVAARIKVGKFDANTEFAFVERAGLFLNSSAGFSPTLPGFPSYPDPAFGGVVEVGWRRTFVDAPAGEARYAVRLGAMDGAAREGLPTGSRGPKTLFGRPDDAVYVVELDKRFTPADDGLSSRVAAGYVFHTGSFPGGDNGGAGLYFVFEADVYRPDLDADRGLSAFAQFSYGGGFFDQHYAAGLVYTGPIPNRAADVAGLYVSYARFNRFDGDPFVDTAETAFELTYAAEIGRGVILQPDVQYILHPGGEGIDHAVVAGARLTVAF